MQYFAGANTKDGFVSLFDEIFSDTKRLYILKGSSGCGKSTLMKRVAGKAQKLGLDTELIYCSSDPSSLDGVIIPPIETAVVDGTAPHLMDVKYPCVRETIINLGKFWDESKLLPHRESIIKLTDEKSMHYKNAYQALASAGSLKALIKQLVNAHIDRAKLDRLAFDISENFTKCQKGRLRYVFASSFSSDGQKCLPVFDGVDSVLHLTGKGSDELMQSLYGILREQGVSAVVSLSCMDAYSADALFLPDTGLLVTDLKKPPCDSAATEKSLSSARFLLKNELSQFKNRIKGLETLTNEVLEEARQELQYAKNAHNALESVYIPAMDFAQLDEYTLSLIGHIFG